jgi:hypothetical protein
MTDAQSRMLDLGAKLASKAAAGGTLSRSEQMVADLLWIDTQVSPNGFDGWLFNTSSERLAATLEALERIGCHAVLDIVRAALRLAGIDPLSMSDGEREEQMDSLSEDERKRLFKLDSAFYESVQDCMATCEAFVASHRSDFTV